MYFERCPRCGEKTYEILSTHCYCVSCNYSPEFQTESDSPPIPVWAIQQLAKLRKTLRHNDLRKQSTIQNDKEAS